MGVADKEWKIWKLFNEPVIEKIRFEETQRQYIGEVHRIDDAPPIMHGFGIFVFKRRRHRYEGEFTEDNFNGYGIYVWQNER